MQLHERHRPQHWDDVVGQPAAVKVCRGLVAAGPGGRAVWITGQSGTGKTTLAKLLAGELADPLCCEELDAGDLTVQRVKDLERESQYYGIGARQGRAYVVNEAHGLRRDVVRQLLVTLERVPGHVLWIFTTTNDGQAALFDGTEDAHPLISRCLPIALARQGLSKPFAARLEALDPVGPRPAEFYRRLIQDNKNNMRAALQVLERDGLTGLADGLNPDGADAPESVATE